MRSPSRVVRFVVKGTSSSGVGAITAIRILASSTAFRNSELCCHLALASFFVIVIVVVALSVASVVIVVFPFVVTCNCRHQTTGYQPYSLSIEL